ncbi:hypothetical protein BDY19DRAFT_974785 [Irpex rosettiformis]|uniref:Uncharacterized protein n=1 Tax=Irpex rosettiformis TaxID=378272 RepID=A0ACB8TPJ4_9APHY|nr:hypothetical protein BDY19DRAFT_974785 [Irpex rosettiformis]
MSATDTTLVDGGEMDVGDENRPDGSSIPTDYGKLKEELETMRKHLAAAKKTISKQSKAMEDLKKDVANAQKSHSEERQNAVRLKAESKKLNEMVTTVEANLACQICMDMLFKPYGLSPCGHVLCLNCLQEWFRRTPPGDEDMDDEDEDPEVVLYRKKSCPVCRTDVFHRPIPVFVIKSIASAFDRVKPGSSRQPSPAHEGDPWSGIFPEAVSPYGDYNDEDDFDGDSMGDETDEGSDGPWPFATYGSDSDDDYYYGEYVHPRWAPPTVHIDPEDYPFDEVTDDVLAMLRRGATPQMILLFQMEYIHGEGLVATMEGNKIYLGWNISLQPEDSTGEEFMDWIEADIVNHPERWDKEDEEGDNWNAWRLIREEEDDEFSNTDSEFWAEDLADLEEY